MNDRWRRWSTDRIELEIEHLERRAAEYRGLAQLADEIDAKVATMRASLAMTEAEFFSRWPS